MRPAQGYYLIISLLAVIIVLAAVIIFQLINLRKAIAAKNDMEDKGYEKEALASDEYENDEEITAAIMGALSEYMDTSASTLRIRSIKRVKDDIPAWRM